MIRTAPLLLVENTALIGITTPMEDTCDYSQMMDMKHDNGEPMFNAISVSLMCQNCRKAGLMECPHMAHEVKGDPSSFTSFEKIYVHLFSFTGATLEERQEERKTRPIHHGLR